MKQNLEKNLSEPVKESFHKKRSLKSIGLGSLGFGAFVGTGSAIAYGLLNDVSYSDQFNVACMLSALYGTVNFAVTGVSEVISRLKDYNKITKY
jgi:hypothetical protein